MTPVADPDTCYICNDKRRTANTDAGVTPTGPQADSETLKQTLIRALSHGHVEDIGSNLEEESRMSSGVCVVSLKKDCNGGLEAVSDRVMDDHIVICKRCTGLLKDFEHHERMAARIAEEIRRFLMRQLEADKVIDVTPVHGRPQITMKKAATNIDERQGIMAAFRALRKSGMLDSKKRGRKRKKEGSGSQETSVEDDLEDEDDDVDGRLLGKSLKETEEEERHRETTSARHSKRIQRRREDGLLMQWGDTLGENEDGMRSDDNDDDLSYYSSSVRRARGRKLTRIIRPVPIGRTGDDAGYKFQCPFCFRYYIPMSSRIHNCTSYKNQLRCLTCNIFFTSTVRLERHLEVIHLKHQHLTCPMEDCDFMCIAEPTLTIHKHFHVLEEAGEAGLGQKRVTRLRKQRIEEILVEDDEQSVVTSPEKVDRVSFLLDESSFLPDGRPLRIMTDKIILDELDDFKVLFFEGDEKKQESSTSSSSGFEIITLDPDKIKCEKSRSNFDLQCPICDTIQVSTKSYEEHMQKVHEVHVLRRTTGEEGSVTESRKGLSSESLTRIVKRYHSVLKKKLHCSSKEYGIKQEDEESKQCMEDKDLSNTADCGECEDGNSLEHKCKTPTFEDKQEYQSLEDDQILTERRNTDHKKKHKCQTCEKLFPSRAHLKEHEISHSSEQQYWCSVCNQGFKRKNALSKHMRIFHPDGPDNTVCSCGKVFASKDLMEKHKDNSGQHRLLVCGECGVLYKTQANLDSHLMLHRETQMREGATWPYTCHTCQDKFSSQASLNIHTKDFHSTSVFQCPECNKTCKTQKLLHFHRLRKHTAGDREFLCPLCSKAFHVLKDLRRHVQTHNPAGARECPVCHSKFKTDSTLRSHIKSHSKGKPYDCSICLFPFCSLEELTTHLQSFHSIDDVGSDFSKTWNSRCLVCGQVFLRRSGLTQHMKSHFEPEGAQLVVLEDTGIEITRNTLVRQELNESPPTLVQTRESEMKKEIPPNHQKLTQAEDNVTRTSKAFLEVNKVTNDKQETVTAAHISSSDELYKASPASERRTITDESEASTLTPYPAGDSAWQERSIQTLENSPQVEGPAASSSSGGEGEETRYICEACSLVLTDMEQLKVHLLTCYKEDSNDECFVVFEVDDNKIQ